MEPTTFEAGGIIGASTGAIIAGHIAYALDDHGVTPPVLRFITSPWGGVFIDPYTIVTGDAALFAVHGEADEMMPVFLSDDLVDRARAAGVPVEYHRVAGTHGFAGVRFFDGALLAEMLDFAESHL